MHHRPAVLAYQDCRRTYRPAWRWRCIWVVAIQPVYSANSNNISCSTYICNSSKLYSSNNNNNNSSSIISNNTSSNNMASVTVLVPCLIMAQPQHQQQLHHLPVNITNNTNFNTNIHSNSHKLNNNSCINISNTTNHPALAPQRQKRNVPPPHRCSNIVAAVQAAMHTYILHSPN